MRTLFIAALALVAALGIPGAAHAHTGLRRSVPAAKSRLEVAPRELRLTFTERPELALARVSLLGPDSAAVALGALRADTGRTVVTDIVGSLVAGTYTVAWQVAGTDGHPVRGRFSFTIAEGADGLAPPASAAPRGEPAGALTAPGRKPPPAAHHAPAAFPSGAGFDAESPLYVLVRWVLLSALVVVLGAVAFRVAVLGRLTSTAAAAPEGDVAAYAAAGAARLGLAASAVLLAATVARLLAQSVAMHGAEGALSPALVGAMLGRTVWGWGWILQLGAALVAIGGFAAARRGARSGWMVAALAALALALTPALSGHAAATPRLTPLAVLADALHVIGAGGWLGSLLVVVAAGVPAALRLPHGTRGRAVADLVHAFSPTALAFAGIAAATGIFAAWLHLGSVASLWQTRYGQLLLTKLAALSLVTATGAYNWLRVRPSLGDESGARRLRRSAGAELAVGVAVVALTAVLVATPPPAEAGASAPPIEGAAP